VAKFDYQKNLLACKTGNGYCDSSLLSPLDAKEVDVIQRHLNALACEAEDFTCDQSLLNMEQAKQSDQKSVSGTTMNHAESSFRR